LGAAVERVEITDLADNTFFSVIRVTSKDGHKVALDCRPSDALAVALRTGADVFVDRQVIVKSRKVESNHLSEEQMQAQKWTEILENLAPEDFGKYKM
jgi:bifunctional DNase/RNase